MPLIRAAKNSAREPSAQETDSITSGTRVLEIGCMIAALKRCATQERTCAEFPEVTNVTERFCFGETS